MKKIIAVACILFTVVCIFTACKSRDDSAATDENIKVVNFDTTRPTEKPTKVRANKTYRIKVSSHLIESEAAGDIEKYAATYGYEIKEEKDGTMTMVMDGRTYSLMLSGIGVKAMRTLGDIVDSGDYPYIVKLADYSSDFSYILMQVNTNKYKKAGKTPSYAEVAELIGLCGLYYQGFTAEEENSCRVVLADSKTGEIVYNEVYTD
jgi:hypothetical protein